MLEPRELLNVRQCLAGAEAEYRSQAGLTRLAEGLALVDDVIAAGSPQHAKTAQTLASTYAARIYGRINKLIESDPGLPEPELEHFFKLVLAFDQTGVELPPSAKTLKIEVVRRLIDRYYEGHPAERKQQALRELQQLSGRD
ncbi:MAG TPA: hypothetical protein VJA26_03135 [Gammaproteobacteria bacterium]|nr:hypothetical protein [Gammaproteobacteria bacterium]